MARAAERRMPLQALPGTKRVFCIIGSGLFQAHTARPARTVRGPLSVFVPRSFVLRAAFGGSSLRFGAQLGFASVRSESAHSAQMLTPSQLPPYPTENALQSV